MKEEKTKNDCTILQTHEIPQIQLEISSTTMGHVLRKISIGVQGYDLEEVHARTKDLAILARSLQDFLDRKQLGDRCAR